MIFLISVLAGIFAEDWPNTVEPLVFLLALITVFPRMSFLEK
jgi:hypothetical protein